MLNTRRLLGGMLAALRGGSATVTAPTEPAEPRLLAKGTMTHRSFLLVMAALLALGTGACSDSGRPPLSPTPVYPAPAPAPAPAPTPTPAPGLEGRILAFVPLQNCCTLTLSISRTPSGPDYLGSYASFKIQNRGNSEIVWTSIDFFDQAMNSSGCVNTFIWCVYEDGGPSKGGSKIIPAGATWPGTFQVKFNPNSRDAVGSYPLKVRIRSNITSGTDTLQFIGIATP